MNISIEGINLIKSFEGYRGTAYDDGAGTWTIGWGHTAGVTKGMTCTPEQAESWLKADLATAEKAVNNCGLNYLNQNQYDALVSFTYNCGAGNLAKLINNRFLAEIADAMLLYNKAGGKVMAGLVRRREAERTLFLKENGETCKNCFPAYNGSSDNLDDMLDAIGYSLTPVQRRIPLAIANGIENYTGTYEQNMQLKGLIWAGTLSRP